MALNNQCTPANCGAAAWALGYTYNLGGNMTSYTTGVGVTFSQAFDSAGRITQLTSSMADANHPGTLATVDATAGYYSTGAVHKITFGNGLTETAAYNKRMQPCRTNVNSTGSILTLCNDAVPSGNVQDFTYGYNPGTTNNGNVVSMSAAGAQTFNRTYGYDSLNRLLTLSAPGDPCSGLSWTYDAWANRTDQTVTGGTCNQFHQPVATNNRISGSGYQYDAAGNLTSDGTHTYFYDAENRIISVDVGSALYIYDAQGHRVRKAIGSTWTDYVYDASGSVVTEFTSQQGACGPICWTTSYINMNGNLVAEYKDGTTYFVHKDHLGSTRLLTRMDRTLQDSMDYLPYGEQIAGDTGTTHKFTGKERDSESGLDYFGARYYSNALGRWVTPDWAAKATAVPYAEFTDPQSLNLYSYVRNVPTTRLDTDGHCAGVDCKDVKVTVQVEEKPKSQENVKVKDANGKEIKITGVEGTLTYTVTVKNKPASEIKVAESNDASKTRNGQPIPTNIIQRNSATDTNGEVGDRVGMFQKTDGSKAENKAIKDDYKNNVWTLQRTQTLTLTLSGGATCTATTTTTLSNAGQDGSVSSHYTLTPTQPVVTQPDK